MMPAATESALDWLYSTQLFGIKLGLENVHRLLSALDLPGRGMRFIHVAGTNGKGSTCAFMHAILRAAGIPAGLFTSPHLVRFNERIQDTHRTITDEEIEAGLNRLRSSVGDWQPHPTFFEMTFVLALDWFRQRGLKWVILETGLGGRLDATNAITPAATVITSISWDHAEILGDTLAKIATEKAGIIKPGVPLITQPQPPEAAEVLNQTAARQRALLTLVEPWAGSQLGLTGPHQRLNAALAVAGLHAAGCVVTPAQIEQGLASVRWPGRFQRVGDVILDGAHNPEAAEVLVRTWQEQYPGTRATVIFGAVGNKDISRMLSILAPLVKEWRFTGFQSPRAVPAGELAEAWKNLRFAPVPVTVCDSVADALSRPAETPRLVAGSLYLVGEVLAMLEGSFSEYRLTSQ